MHLIKSCTAVTLYYCKQHKTLKKKKKKRPKKRPSHSVLVYLIQDKALTIRPVFGHRRFSMVISSNLFWASADCWFKVSLSLVRAVHKCIRRQAFPLPPCSHNIPLYLDLYFSRLNKSPHKKVGSTFPWPECFSTPISVWTHHEQQPNQLPELQMGTCQFCNYYYNAAFSLKSRKARYH